MLDYTKEVVFHGFKRRQFYIPDFQMIDAIVVARHSDPLATKVIDLLNQHVDGSYNDNRVMK